MSLEYNASIIILIFFLCSSSIKIVLSNNKNTSIFCFSKLISDSGILINFICLDFNISSVILTSLHFGILFFIFVFTIGYI